MRCTPPESKPAPGPPRPPFAARAAPWVDLAYKLVAGAAAAAALWKALG